jgi:multimeric flavodoxin WrbA
MAVKIILAPTWELAEPIEADVTVEAEYGAHVKEGTKQTLAHHSGKYKGGPAVSTMRPKPLGSGTILVSHLDLDTIIACLDLLGMSDKVSDKVREICGYVDVNGPHRLGDIDISKEDDEKIHAWWATEEAMERKPRDKITDVTEDVKKAGKILGEIMTHEKGHIEKGKKFKEDGEKLDEESFFDSEGIVLVRKSDQFVNHLYKHDKKVYKGVAALNTKHNSVTVSLERAVPGVSCKNVVQGLWGPEAGGHDGIAGSPRGKSMTEKDLKDAAKALDMALKGKSKEALDWVGHYLS